MQAAESPLSWLTPLVLYTLVILRPCPSQLVGPPKSLPVTSSYKLPALVHASDFPRVSQRFTEPRQAASGLSMSCTSGLNSPKLSTSGSQPSFVTWPLKALPSTAQVVAICRLLCGSCHMALGVAWAVAEIDLQRVPSQMTLGLASPVASFETSWSITQPTPRVTHPRGG